MSVPDQVKPVLRVADCHVMVVPVVTMASVAVRVSVIAAAGVSMRSRLLVRAPCESVLITGELKLDYLTSITFILYIHTNNLACDCARACIDAYEITEKIITRIA